MVRAFSHLAMMLSVLLIPVGPNPNSRSKQEQIIPTPPCPGSKNLYQAATGQWEEVALSSQPSHFPSGPSSNCCCRVQGLGLLSQIRDFTTAPPLCKSTTPLDFRTS